MMISRALVNVLIDQQIGQQISVSFCGISRLTMSYLVMIGGYNK